MYKYVFSSEDSEKIKTKAELDSELENKFTQVDDKYDPVIKREITGSLNLEKMEYDAPSQEEIKKKAENSLYEYKTENEKSINSSYEKKMQGIENEINETSQTVETEKDELQTLYGSLKKNFSDEALKRGLARSSIVVNKLEAFDRDMLDKYLQLDKQYQTSISNLNEEKELLSFQKDNALSNFNIAYAVKLETKINDISEEIKKQEESVLKYNNEILEKEAEFKREQDKLNNTYARQDKQDALDYFKGKDEKDIYALEAKKAQEKYLMAYNYLMSMPKEQAISEVDSNAIYRKNLGNFFEKLVTEIKKRAD